MHSAALRPLVLGATGVVPGGNGASRLYAVFSTDHGLVRPAAGDVYGVIPMVFWSVVIVVSATYVTLVVPGSAAILTVLAALAAIVASQAAIWTLLVAVIVLILAFPAVPPDSPEPAARP